MEKKRLASHPHMTKIVATVGVSASKQFLQKLHKLGADVFRLNSAHMSVDDVQKMVSLIRSVSPKLAILLDTKGPNIRTCGMTDEGLSLKKGQVIKISGVEGNDGRVCVNYAPFAKEVPIGSRIVCDDGAAKFHVTGKSGACLLCTVDFDTVLKNRKSINVPDVSLKAPSLTEKDKEFLKEAVVQKVDFIAHSFVRDANDVLAVRQALGDAGKAIKIIAKIENREGVTNIDEILASADGIMVARGDLGIEIPLEEVPGIQKKLIFKARMYGKPVITATQMLQSMVSAPAPTRAEVSDVANAVYDGSDAVMLSGETACGKYPCESVEMMRNILVEAEKAPHEFFTEILDNIKECDASVCLLGTAVRVTKILPITAIVCSTLSGDSARSCSAFRPNVCVFAATPSETTMRQLALSYGVFSSLVDFDPTPETQVSSALESVSTKDLKFDKKDQIALLGKMSPVIEKNNLLGIISIDELNHIYSASK